MRGSIDVIRERREVARAVVEDRNNPDWLFFNLWRERLALEDSGDRDSAWHGLVVRALAHLANRDWSELERTVRQMAEAAGVDHVSLTLDGQ